MGLGLYIAVSSSIGAGTIFNLSLPRAPVVTS